MMSMGVKGVFSEEGVEPLAILERAAKERRGVDMNGLFRVEFKKVEV